jgi:hypothetical protein
MVVKKYFIYYVIIYVSSRPSMDLYLTDMHFDTFWVGGQ